MMMGIGLALGPAFGTALFQVRNSLIFYHVILRYLSFPNSATFYTLS